MARMVDYGFRVFPHGIVFHSDRRRRRKTRFVGELIIPWDAPKTSARGRIRAFSKASMRNLAFVAANAGVEFKSHLTLTYHAVNESWEDDEGRNRRIVKRSKRDLNRFLTAMRPQLGAYLWAQEFQARGVIHYHLLAERDVFEPEAKMVWCRATDEFDDAAARLHALRIRVIEDQGKARFYLGRYIGKGRQKRLPEEIDGAGRWWGASRSVRLPVLAEVVSWPKGSGRRNGPEVRIVRTLRRFVSRLFGFPFTGGAMVDWRGDLAAKVARAVEESNAFYGRTVPTEQTLESWGWERVVEEVCE